MICSYPTCDCRLNLPHGQLFPRQGQCPHCEELRADLGLDALKHDLYDLLKRETRVWKNKDRATLFRTLATAFDRLEETVDNVNS